MNRNSRTDSNMSAVIEVLGYALPKGHNLAHNIWALTDQKSQVMALNAACRELGDTMRAHEDASAELIAAAKLQDDLTAAIPVVEAQAAQAIVDAEATLAQTEDKLIELGEQVFNAARDPELNALEREVYEKAPLLEIAENKLETLQVAEKAAEERYNDDDATEADMEAYEAAMEATADGEEQLDIAMKAHKAAEKDVATHKAGSGIDAVEMELAKLREQLPVIQAAVPAAKAAEPMLVVEAREAAEQAGRRYAELSMAYRKLPVAKTKSDAERASKKFNAACRRLNEMKAKALRGLRVYPYDAEEAAKARRKYHENQQRRTAEEQILREREAAQAAEASEAA